MTENIAKVNAKYREQARDLLSRNLSSENFTKRGLDDREEVQHVSDGAFVHAWIWIPKEWIDDTERPEGETPNAE